jgi:hypothetical protein
MVANLIQIEDEATLVCADVITNPLPIHPATHSTGNIPRFSLVMLLSNPAARSTILLNWSSDKSSNLTPAAPDFVEVGEAGVAVSDAMRHQRCVQLLGDVFALVSCQRGSENRQVLMSFQSTEALGCFQHAGGLQRSAIAALRQRFTLRQTLRTVPIMFLIALVQASERRSGVGNLRRVTVSISSNPSRMLAATRGAS